MGYNFYITRKQNIFNEGSNITTEEWLALVQLDGSLSINAENGDCFVVWKNPLSNELDWLDWEDGNIFSKNPSTDFRFKMIDIAFQPNARLIGEDGEIYNKDGKVVFPQSKRNCCILRRIKNILTRKKAAQKINDLPFSIGEQVIDTWGNKATVTRIDLTAEHENGLITVQYDDHREASSLATAHGLKKVLI